MSSELDLVSLADHLLAAKYYMLAGFIMLVWDTIITMEQEVELFWKQPKGFVSGLYFLNRYASTFQYPFIIAMAQSEYLSTPDVCSRIVKFAGACTLSTVAVIGIILTLRTYALYGRNPYIFCLLATLWLGEVIMMAMTMTHCERVPLPEGFVGCILTAEQGYQSFTTWFWVSPMIFDIVVFLLTILRAYSLSRRSVRMPLLSLFIRDGSAYFLVIVASNVVNVALYLTVPPDLQAINATFTHLIGVLLVNRLMLNLKALSLKQDKAASSIGYRQPTSTDFVSKANNWTGATSVFATSIGFPDQTFDEGVTEPDHEWCRSGGPKATVADILNQGWTASS